MRGRALQLAGSLAVLGVATLAAAGSGGERSPAVYPPQRLPLRFDHSRHLAAGADCATCHPAARTSAKASDRLLPGADPASPHAECEGCHEIEAAREGKQVEPRSACRDCHLGYDLTVHREVSRVELPPPNLLFSHELHVARKIECRACHGDLRQVALATREQLPKMESCLGCHDGRRAPAECRVCHPADPAGRLRLSFPSGALRPGPGDPFGLDHGPRFELTHGARAALDRRACASCHAESHCQRCHDSLQKPFSVHPNDFIALHAAQARGEAMRCEGCHRRQSFCAACHERAGVGPDADPTLRPTGVRVHPNHAEWVDLLGPRHHAIAASRDLAGCISCHREESCTPCHATRGVTPRSRAINPHPSGFASVCRMLAAKNDRGCLKCHTREDLSALGCR